MKFISTRNANHTISFHDALFRGLADDGGLYIPKSFPKLSPATITHANDDTLIQLGERIMQPFTSEIPIDALKDIMHATLNFPIPLVHLGDHLYLLEVFHGPTLAFKDVGARFMANTLSYFQRSENQRINILVATSGDTGSAIAHAFHHLPNINVYILYPSQKITFLQEQQITTLGDNIHAIEVQGTFDDCQHLVKTALLDATLRKNCILTTANSINIARLLPQIIYHTSGLCQLRKQGIHTAPILSVPSGNFGNLTSAIYAQLLGFDIKHFIAATNINDIIPHYLKTSYFAPQPSKHSLSNAMDVGNPSNFERLLTSFNNDYASMRQQIDGIAISDTETLAEIRNTYQRNNYILDPHTAVGVAAARKYTAATETPIIITATAHPAKFPEAIKQAIDREAEMPARLLAAVNGKKQAILMPPSIDAFKKLLLTL